MGDTDFETLEVEEIAKDMATIQQDAQVHKVCTPVQTTEKVTYMFHVSNLNSFFNSENCLQKVTFFNLPFSFL